MPGVFTPSLRGRQVGYAGAANCGVRAAAPGEGLVVIQHKRRFWHEAVTHRFLLRRHDRRVRFSPRVHDLLVEHARRERVDRMSVAEVWRSVREEAWRLGLTPPSYHAVLPIVNAERARRAARRQLALEAVDQLWRYPGPDVVELSQRAAALRRRGGR
jgi:hypothetical protein